MSAFLNWLFAKQEALRYILGNWYSAIEAWGHWYSLRGFKLLFAWWGRIYDVFNNWYDRIKVIFYDVWYFVYGTFTTYLNNLWALIWLWFDRISYVVNGRGSYCCRN